MSVLETDIPTFLDRRSYVWTFSSLSTYRNVCAYQMYRRYIIKNIPYTETPAMKRGNDVHTALELRLTGGKPLPVDMQAYEVFCRPLDGKAIKCEPKLAVTREFKPCGYFDSNVWGRGRADVVMIQDGKALLLDWKSGNVREDSFELEVQAVLLKAKYPHLKKITGRYVWLKEMRLGESHDCSDIETTQKTITNLVRMIESDKQRDDFEKEPGPLCGGAWGSCPVADCEHRKGTA